MEKNNLSRVVKKKEKVSRDEGGRRTRATMTDTASTPPQKEPDCGHSECGHNHSHGGHGHSHGKVLHSAESATDPPKNAVPAPRRVDLTQGEDGWEDPLGSGALILKREKGTEDAKSKNSRRNAQLNQAVTVNIKGWLLSDPSVIFQDDSNVECFLGDDTLCPGVELATRCMSSGEEALVRMEARFAYGDREHKGPLARVPANSNVGYRISLLSTGRMMPDPEEMNPTDRLTFGSQRKDVGNRRYRVRRFREAVKFYEQALKNVGEPKDWAKASKEQAAALKQLWIACINNICAVRMAQKDYTLAARRAEQVLKADPDNQKAVERHAAILVEMRDSEAATGAVSRGLARFPESKRLRALRPRIERLKAAAERRNRKFAEGFAKMEFSPEGSAGTGDNRSPDDDASGKNSSESKSRSCWDRVFVKAGVALAAVGLGAFAVYGRGS